MVLLLSVSGSLLAAWSGIDTSGRIVVEVSETGKTVKLLNDVGLSNAATLTVTSVKGTYIKAERAIRMEAYSRSIKERKGATIIRLENTGDPDDVYGVLKMEAEYKDGQRTYIERAWQGGSAIIVSGSFMNSRPEDEDFVRNAVKMTVVTVHKGPMPRSLKL